MRNNTGWKWLRLKEQCMLCKRPKEETTKWFQSQMSENRIHFRKLKDVTSSPYRPSRVLHLNESKKVKSIHNF